MILKYTIIVFVTQLIFIACRTWNVKAIGAKNIPQVIISGVLVHLSWLVSIAVGAISMHEIISNFEWSYTPIIVASVVGTAIGGYISMKK